MYPLFLCRGRGLFAYAWNTASWLTAKSARNAARPQDEISL